MIKPLLSLLLFSAFVSAQDITVSKDSLWVYNSNVSSRADQVIFTSSYPASINLDSAHIAVEEMDTTGLGYIPPEYGLEAVWYAGSAPYPFFVWTMDSVGAKEFVLKKKDFLPPEELPLSFAKSGDSASIGRLSIGFCFVCNSRPRYPALFRGTLKLFFSNNQTIALRLYSDDLRKKASASPRRGSITTCMFGDSLDFSLINDSCQKRINLMQTCSFNTCTVGVPDVRIMVNSIVAPSGVLYLGTSSDTGCLDTLKRVPQSGYVDSVPFGYSGGYLFAVKTSETNYAALHLVASGSGVPFRQFKWVYQPDGSPDFIKTTSVSRRETPTTHLNVNSVWGVYSINGRKMASGARAGRMSGVFITVQQTGLCKKVLSEMGNKP